MWLHKAASTLNDFCWTLMFANKMVDYTVSFALKIHAKTCISPSIYDSASLHFSNAQSSNDIFTPDPFIKIQTHTKMPFSTLNGAY